MALEISGVPITADSVKTKLLQEIKSSDSVSLYASKPSRYKQKDYDNSPKSSKGPLCFKCNRYGHISVKIAEQRKWTRQRGRQRNWICRYALGIQCSKCQ